MSSESFGWLLDWTGLQFTVGFLGIYSLPFPSWGGLRSPSILAGSISGRKYRVRNTGIYSSTCLMVVGPVSVTVILKNSPAPRSLCYRPQNKDI